MKQKSNEENGGGREEEEKEVDEEGGRGVCSKVRVLTAASNAGSTGNVAQHISVKHISIHISSAVTVLAVLHSTA